MILDILHSIIHLYLCIVVVQIVVYWLMHFNILVSSNKYVQKTIDLLNKATVPVYEKIKSKIPTVYAGFDFAPFILLVALYIIKRIIYILA